MLNDHRYNVKCFFFFADVVAVLVAFISFDMCAVRIFVMQLNK